MSGTDPGMLTRLQMLRADPEAWERWILTFRLSGQAQWVSGCPTSSRGQDEHGERTGVVQRSPDAVSGELSLQGNMLFLEELLIPEISKVRGLLRLTGECASLKD